MKTRQARASDDSRNGVGSVAISHFDPSGVIPFAVKKPDAEDNYTSHLRYPQSREPASTFTPDFVFGAATGMLGEQAIGSVYRGPGHAGDLTGRLGFGGAAASRADRIQALGPGTVEFGSLVSGNGDFAFWAGRVDDGVSPTRLMAVTSYVGDGTASRNIPLTLGGNAPVFATVVPTNATQKVYRVTGDTTGRTSHTGAAVANSITALGANQITVGINLNAMGVTYDVWTITTGTVTP